MKAPAAFYKYTLNFLHPNESGFELEEAVPFAFRNLTKSEKQELRDYFAHLLSSGLSREALLARWREGNAGIFFPEHTAEMMTFIIEALDKDAAGEKWPLPKALGLS